MEGVTIPVKAYSKKELATLYGVSKQTLRRWLKNVEGLQQTNDQIFTPNQIQLIFKHLGVPE